MGWWRSATFCRCRYSGAAVCLDSLLTAHEVVVCVSGLGVVNIVAVVCLLLLGCCCAIVYVFCDEGKLVFILSGLVFVVVFGWRHAASALPCVFCESVRM